MLIPRRIHLLRYLLYANCFLQSLFDIVGCPPSRQAVKNYCTFGDRENKLMLSRRESYIGILTPFFVGFLGIILHPSIIHAQEFGLKILSVQRLGDIARTSIRYSYEPGYDEMTVVDISCKTRMTAEPSALSPRLVKQIVSKVCVN